MKYKCRYIDSGICFFYKTINFCCKSAHNGKGELFLSKYDDFNVNEVLQKKEEYKKALYEGNIPDECTGCVFLEETEEITKDNSISVVDIDSFTRCNSKCVYCEVHTLGIPDHPILPIFETLFKNKILKNDKEGYIQFAGGEPTIMKDFEKVVELCIKNGIENYMIHSNGIRFSKSIEKLIKTENVKLIISLDSACRETFKKVKNVDCFNKVVESMKKYAKAQKDGECTVRSKYIIIPEVNDNIDEILKWYDLSVNMGIRMLILDVEMGWFKKNNQTLTPEILQIVKTIQEKAKKDNIVLDYYESLKVWFNNNPV